LLEEMRAKGVEPDVITYNASISACGKGGQWEKALQLLEEMRAKGVEPDVFTYGAVIDAVVDQLTFARGLLKKALALGVFAKPVQASDASSWKLDLHEHSEGSAVTAVRWWLEEEIRPWLSEQPSSVYPDITVELITGWGKHRGAGKTGDIKQAVAQALVAMGVPFKPEDRNHGRLTIDCAAWMQQSREHLGQHLGQHLGRTAFEVLQRLPTDLHSLSRKELQQFGRLLGVKGRGVKLNSKSVLIIEAIEMCRAEAVAAAEASKEEGAAEEEEEAARMGAARMEAILQHDSFVPLMLE
jgi:pentatricopeptide repeat protein